MELKGREKRERKEVKLQEGRKQGMRQKKKEE